MDFLKLLLSALFIFFMTLASVGLISARYGKDPWPWWGCFVPILTMFAGICVAIAISHTKFFRSKIARKSHEELIQELSADDLLTVVSFKAKRAYFLPETEDEGSTYYIELEDNSVLCLTGQYLYEYEPVIEEAAPAKPQLFPCTEFEVVRHKIDGYVLELRCKGEIIQADIANRTFLVDDSDTNFPEDGEIIEHKSYDQLIYERSMHRKI
jgi:hypothetical protein